MRCMKNGTDAAGDRQMKALLQTPVFAAKTNCTDRDGMTMLMIASRNGFPESVRALLEIGDLEVNATHLAQGEQLEDDALTYAIAGGHADIALRLIAAKADATVSNPYKKWAIDVASDSGSLEVVRALLNAKAHPKWQSLCYASANGHAPVVRALLEAKADVNAGSQHPASAIGYTALMGAAHGGRVDVVNMLLEAKAEVDMQSDLAQCPTALMSAIKSESSEVVDNNKRVDVIKLLLDANADPNFANASNGETALMAASEFDRLDVVRMLLLAGANTMDSIPENLNDRVRKLLASWNEKSKAEQALARLWGCCDHQERILPFLQRREEGRKRKRP